MDGSQYKLEFEELCRHTDLGKLINAAPISGGLLHRMYAVETTEGKYAVKLLNPNIMSRETAMVNYINSERIASYLSSKIPGLPADKKDGKFVQNLNGQFYLVFQWAEGKSLKWSEIKTSHCEIIAGILAEIHQTDFSELTVPHERTDKGKPIDWNNYLQQGKQECAEWVEGYQAIIDKLQVWYASAIAATEYLEVDMMLSHRDLDPKNVLWQENKPLLIDWESAGFINPYQDLLETAIYWSANEDGEIDQQRLNSFMRGYKERSGELYADWDVVLATGFSGKLEWLEYNLKRSLWIECADEQEQQMGTAQVTRTIRELKDYAEQLPLLHSWLNGKE